MPSMRVWLFTHLSSRQQQWTSGSTHYVDTNHHRLHESHWAECRPGSARLLLCVHQAAAGRSRCQHWILLIKEQHLHPCPASHYLD